MQVIAAVVDRQELCRMIRVAHDRVEIDHSVERVAGADPLVDHLTLGLVLRGSPRSLPLQTG